MKLFEQPLEKIFCSKQVAATAHAKLNSYTSLPSISLKSKCPKMNPKLAPKLPPPINNLLAELYTRGPSTVGIFRKSPNAKQCKELRHKLEVNSTAQIDNFPVTVVASVFKEWLRSLPDCLLMSQLYDQWIEAAKLIEPLQQGSNADLHAKTDVVDSCTDLRNVSLGNIDMMNDENSFTSTPRSASNNKNYGSIFKFAKHSARQARPLDRARSCTTVQFDENGDCGAAPTQMSRTPINGGLAGAQSATDLSQNSHLRAKREAESRRMVSKLINSLDEPNLILLRAVICVLWHIAENSDFNKMSAQNLGVCVGQSLLNDNCKKATSVKRHLRTRSQCLLSLTLSWSSPSSNASRSFVQLGAAQEIAKYVPMLVAFMIENAHELFGADVTSLFSAQVGRNKVPNLSNATKQEKADSADCNANTIQLLPTADSSVHVGLPGRRKAPSALTDLNLFIERRKPDCATAGHCPEVNSDTSSTPPFPASRRATIDQLDGMPLAREDLNRQSTPKLSVQQSLQAVTTGKAQPISETPFAASVAMACKHSNRSPADLCINDKRPPILEKRLQLDSMINAPQPAKRKLLGDVQGDDGQRSRGDSAAASTDDDDYKTTITIVNNKIHHQQALIDQDTGSQRAPSSVLGAHSPTLSNYTQSHSSSQAEISVSTSSTSSPSVSSSSSSFSSLSPSSTSSPMPTSSASTRAAHGITSRSDSLANNSQSSIQNNLLAAASSLTSLSMSSPSSDSGKQSSAACSPHQHELIITNGSSNKSPTSDGNQAELVRTKLQSLNLEVRNENLISADKFMCQNDTMRVLNSTDAQQYQRNPITRQEMLRRRHMMNRYSTILGIPNRVPNIPICLTTSNYGGEAVIYNPQSTHAYNGQGNLSVDGYLLNQQHQPKPQEQTFSCIDQYNQSKVITVEEIPLQAQDTVPQQQLITKISQTQPCFMPLSQHNCVYSHQQPMGNGFCCHQVTINGNQLSHNQNQPIPRHLAHDYHQEPLRVSSRHSLTSAPSLPFLSKVGSNNFNHNQTSKLGSSCYPQQHFQQKQQIVYQNQQFHTQPQHLPLRYTSSNTNLNHNSLIHHHHELYQQLQPQRSHVMLLRDHYLALQNQQRLHQQQQNQNRPVSLNFGPTHHRPPVLYTLL